MTDKNRINALIVLLVVFGTALGIYFFVLNPKEKNAVSSNNSTQVVTMGAESGSAKPASIQGYEKIISNPSETTKSNTYKTTVNYEVPDSTQSLTLTITLENSLIKDINAELSMSGRDSNGYQSKFQNSYKSLVLGKNIKDVNISRVGGASLTSKAFMDAITAVKNQL